MADESKPGYLHIPDSFIRNIALEVYPDYELSNSPFPTPSKKRNSRRRLSRFVNKVRMALQEAKKPVDPPRSLKKVMIAFREAKMPVDPPFIGREKSINKFLSFLKSPIKQGVYLVTGNRGMGKTSFVNKVLDIYIQTKKNQVILVYLSLAQQQLKEIDVLRTLTSLIYEKYSQSLKSRKVSGFQMLVDLLKLFIFIGVAGIILPVVVYYLMDKIPALKGGHFFGEIDKLYKKPDFFYRLQVATVSLVVILYLVKKISGIFGNKELSLIRNLNDRCYASVMNETSSKSELNIESIGTRIFGSSETKGKIYPVATSKEIEYELSFFLRAVSSKKEFIFIFDELDKVDPAVSTNYYYEEMDTFESKTSRESYLLELRDRKQAILNIIAGLKNFLTTSRARFIFIAGREMFDASLADIADRQSAVSSIFNYVFNIESFLKETTSISGKGNKSSLSGAIEDYLQLVLFGYNEETASVTHRMKTYYQRVNGQPMLEEELNKVTFILQNFIIYLTYRSNGSPKKIIRAIHEFIEIRKTPVMEEQQQETLRSKEIIFIHRSRRSSVKTPQKFLTFNYNNQYRIGFINYLYRPYLVRYGKSFKNYSDNIIVSTPYLFDHLLKFHPFAFSVTNLELIPEVLSTNKTPSLRNHIAEIIDYLGNNHIREAEISLFDYKFYSRTLNEIIFISKTFEEESAAFNFTLDEGYLVKLHVRTKIKELRSIYGKFGLDSDNSNQQVFSIAHLNDVLGDLHFFDQEYDDAIVAYSDAIKPINNLDISRINLRDFVMLIRIKLKLGLVFEKVKSYEEALSFYSDAAQDSKRFVVHRLVNGDYIDVEKEKQLKKRRDSNKQNRRFEINDPSEDKSPPVYHSSSLNDLLQIVNQCFLAKIIIQEKMGVEGATNHKLALSMGGFLKLAEGIEISGGRNHLIIANMYLISGNLLYFKNSNRNFIFLEGGKTELLNKKFPEDSLTKIESFKDAYNKTYNKEINKRKPLTALYFYCIGLSEILSCRNNKIDFDFSASDSAKTRNITYPIFKKLSQFSEFGEMYTRNHYKYIAIFLSNIGDCLYGMFTNDVKSNYNRYLIGDLFYLPALYEERKAGFVNIISGKLTFDYFLRLNGPSKNQLCDVLRCYYLSGQFFLKRGRSVSCSLQYRKILYVLRMVLQDRFLRDKDHSGTATLFLKVLEETIVKQILKIISQNSENSDRHMFNKYKKINVIKDDVAILNNISNHPETREVILLYSYIQIKVAYSKSLVFDKLISSYNSIATQFSRLSELDFYAKLSYIKLITAADDTLRFRESINFLFSMLSILRILNIYGTDYMIGLSYQAYTHFKIAQFLNIAKLTPGLAKYFDDIYFERLRDEIVKVLNRDPHNSFDKGYHYMMAKTFYERAIQLHTAGQEYKKVIGNMVYLEDDINDNAYHFGAAMDRYMMINEVFYQRIRDCENQQEELKEYGSERYTGNYSH